MNLNIKCKIPPPLSSHSVDKIITNKSKRIDHVQHSELQKANPQSITSGGKIVNLWQIPLEVSNSVLFPKKSKKKKIFF